MRMKSEVKDFLEKHEDLIKQEDFEKLYNIGKYEISNIIPDLTRVFFEAGIDPLEYMNEIPSFYLEKALITDFYCPESIKYIGRYAFNECKNLTKITVGTNVTSIDSYAFSWCESLIDITIPDSVVSMGDGVFLGCTGLKHITWNAKNCQELGWGWKIGPIFGECLNVTTLTIGDGVNILPDYIFNRCTGLKTVIISDSVASIGSNVFAACPNLVDINFKGTKIQWQNIQKSESWNESSAIKIVRCIDGDINLN